MTKAAIPPAPDPAGTAVGDPVPRLSAREARWVLRRCSRHGHLLAHLDDPIGERFRAPGPFGILLRCLRCGAYVDENGPTTPPSRVIGAAGQPAPLAEVPLAVRGGHGRKLAILRLLAAERIGRGVLLWIAAMGLARLANSHVAVADWLGQLAKSAAPLGNQLGWDVLHSHLLAQAQELLGHSATTYTTVAWLLAGYGLIEVVEGGGLWGGWLWAEYLAAVATAAFIPLEVYELFHHYTLLKSGALAVNIAAVIYLVVKGRLFGVRGGHPAYRAEVRDATLLADELRAAGRSSTALSSHTLA